MVLLLNKPCAGAVRAKQHDCPNDYNSMMHPWAESMDGHQSSAVSDRVASTTSDFLHVHHTIAVESHPF